MLHLMVYVLLIAAVNLAFAVTPPIPLPNGDLWPPVSLAVGFVFVVRDYAQRRAGHNILWAMAAGCALSWFMATPELAVASAAAFAVGELADWAVFTFSKRSFAQRILVSSLLGVPLDTAIFLSLIGLASPWGFATMCASKLLGALAVYMLVRRREAVTVRADGM